MPDTALTAERIKEIRARCEAATEGDWFCAYSSVQVAVPKGHPLDIACADEPSIAEVATITNLPGTSGGELHHPECRANRDFITHARTDLPDALDAIEALRKRVGNLGALLRELFYHADGQTPAPLLSRMRMTLRTESSVDQAEPPLDMIPPFTEGDAAGRDDGVKGGDA